VLREENKFAVDEVGLVDFILLTFVIVHSSFILDAGTLPLPSPYLVEMYLVHIEVRKIFLGIAAGQCSQTFVILDVPSLGIILH
jgi:hypothetical protein